MNAIFDKYAEHYDIWFKTPAGNKVFICFFNPNPPEFVLTKASAIEAFGKKYCKPFGALLAGTPSSDISNQS